MPEKTWRMDVCIFQRSDQVLTWILPKNIQYGLHQAEHVNAARTHLRQVEHEADAASELRPQRTTDHVWSSEVKDVTLGGTDFQPRKKKKKKKPQIIEWTITMKLTLFLYVTAKDVDQRYVKAALITLY